MIERKLFELPIYSMSEENLQDSGDLLTWGPMYNQVVGYVMIFITTTDVGFFKFEHLGQGRCIQYLEKPGALVHVDGRHKNQDIKDKIKNKLVELGREISSEGHVLDTSAFDNVIGYINIRRAINDLIKETPQCETTDIPDICS